MRKLVRLKHDQKQAFIDSWSSNKEVVKKFGTKPFYVVLDTNMDNSHERGGRWQIEEAVYGLFGEEIDQFFEVVKEDPKTIFVRLNENQLSFRCRSSDYRDFADKFKDEPVLMVEDTPFGGNTRWKTVANHPGDRVFRIWDGDINRFFSKIHNCPYDQYRTAVATAMEAMPPVEQSTENLRVARCPNGVKAVPEQNLEQFNIKVKTVFVNQKVTSDNLEDFIKELREKFK